MSEEHADRPAADRIWIDAIFLAGWLVLGAIVGAGLIFLVPKYAEIFAQLDVDLPVPTRIVLRTSMLFVSWWFVILPLVLLISIVPMAIAPGRSWPLYLVATLLLLMLSIGGYLSVVGPLVKIQAALGRNKGGPPPAAVAPPAESPPPGGR